MISAIPIISPVDVACKRGVVLAEELVMGQAGHGLTGGPRTVKVYLSRRVTAGRGGGGSTQTMIMISIELHQQHG